MNVSPHVLDSSQRDKAAAHLVVRWKKLAECLEIIQRERLIVKGKDGLLYLWHWQLETGEHNACSKRIQFRALSKR